MSNEPTGLVRYKLDPDNPPTLTAEEQQAWKELQEMRDEDIDYSDIPPCRLRAGGGYRILFRRKTSSRLHCGWMQT